MAEKGIFFRLARKDDYYEEISEFVASLRSEGRLVKVLKNGLALMWDLMNYRTDVLVSLFPWVKEAFCPPTDPGDMSRIISDEVARQVVAAMQKQQQQGRDIPDTRDYGVPAMKPSKLQKSIALPLFDDDADEGATIVLGERRQNDMTTTNNFLASFASLGD